MDFEGIEHVQLAMPAGKEGRARLLTADLLFDATAKDLSDLTIETACN